MFDALYISATGMQSQQLNVDTIANNVANVNTMGFKKSRVNFTDLVAQDPTRAANGAARTDNLLAAAMRLGAGVGVSGISKMFDPGELKQTNLDSDIAINGTGFLEVVMPDGSRAFTRGGSLKINADGQLATQAGNPLRPAIRVPDGVQRLAIQPDGHVQALMANQSTPLELGQLDLVRFNNEAGLLAQYDGLYRASDASGEGVSARAGEDGVGVLAQGWLEGSNVKLVDEMVNMMVAQRSYQANTKILQAADEMLGMINGLRR